MADLNDDLLSAIIEESAHMYEPGRILRRASRLGAVAGAVAGSGVMIGFVLLAARDLEDLQGVAPLGAVAGCVGAVAGAAFGLVLGGVLAPMATTLGSNARRSRVVAAVVAGSIVASVEPLSLLLGAGGVLRTSASVWGWVGLIGLSMCCAAVCAPRVYRPRSRDL